MVIIYAYSICRRNKNDTYTEDRILVTLDEYFGDGVISALSEHPGVIRLKINPTTSWKGG